MTRPVFLVENLYSTIQFPSHTVTANTEATNQEVELLADGRRSDTDYWAPTTENVDAWAKVNCDRVRLVDMVAIDRGHNLAGKTVALAYSNDDFATAGTDVLSITFPSVSVPGDLDDATGVVTEEGAWVKRFDAVAAKDFRLYVTAAASYIPQVVGLWLGKSYSPAHINFPLQDEDTELIQATVESDYGWAGTSEGAERRFGTIRYLHPSLDDYDDGLRYHLGHFKKGRPMWMVFAEEEAQRAVLARRGGVSSVYTEQHVYRETSIPWVEWEPKV
jgi:hypothetical protein